jgi:hypothetical protein
MFLNTDLATAGGTAGVAERPAPERFPPAPSSVPRAFPLREIVAAVTRSEMAGVLAALNAAGFASERIEILNLQSVPGLRASLVGSGFPGVLTRLQVLYGTDFERIEQERLDLFCGTTLIQILVHGDGEYDASHELPEQRRGQTVRYFGRWPLASSEGGSEYRLDYPISGVELPGRHVHG